jgi:uncharacterized protein (DUF58 family)
LNAFDHLLIYPAGPRESDDHFLTITDLALSSPPQLGWGFVVNFLLFMAKIDWTYDALDRLTGELRDVGPIGVVNPADVNTIYALDLTGNRLTKTINNGNDATFEETINYTYNAND